MIRVFDRISDISFSELMSVYEEGNRLNSEERYAGRDKNAAILQVEQDFYGYLKDVFFKTEDSKYFVCIEDGKYICALRTEPYADGVLIEGLETRPEFRRKGYAKYLVREVLDQIEGPVYSHVLKDNLPSLSTHFSCGFEIISQSAEYIDGTICDNCFTLARK